MTEWTSVGDNVKAEMGIVGGAKIPYSAGVFDSPEMVGLTKARRTRKSMVLLCFGDDKRG